MVDPLRSGTKFRSGTAARLRSGMPLGFGTPRDKYVRLQLTVQHGMVVAAPRITNCYGRWVKLTSQATTLEAYLVECPAWKEVHAVCSGNAVTMKKSDWLEDKHSGEPECQLTTLGSSYSDFCSVYDLVDQLRDTTFLGCKTVTIFETCNDRVFLMYPSQFARILPSELSKFLGESQSVWLPSGLSRTLRLFDSDEPESQDSEGCSESGDEEMGGEESISGSGSEDSGEECSSDEDMGEKFKSGRNKLEGMLFGLSTIGSWDAFKRFEAGDNCASHLHDWECGDMVCAPDYVMVRILRGEKNGGASGTHKCYVALLWDLKNDQWLFKTLTQLGKPIESIVGSMPATLKGILNQLKTYQLPSVSAALSQAARSVPKASQSGKGAATPRLQSFPVHDSVLCL